MSSIPVVTNGALWEEGLALKGNKQWRMDRYGTWDILDERIWGQQTEKASRYNIEKDKTVTVGVTNVSYAESTLKTDNTTPVDNGLTAEVMDFTTHPDRALVRLKNELGYNLYLTRFQVMGNRIQKSNGKAGSLLLDQLKRDDDIRRNGEIVKTISNDYIFDATQVATLADYWYKRCGQKKHLYALQVKGSALWYEPGDWYTLALGGAGRNEYISAVVEIVSVSVQRTNGGIGSTQLIVRECMESWSKTTLYTARLITGASPKRRPNQSNTLIVASSSFDGTYDYRCDGTADDVQIQAAIDYLDSIGGGKIELTAGEYNIDPNASPISIKTNILLEGKGKATIIYGIPSTFQFANVDNSEIRNFTIDGSNATEAFVVVACVDNTSGSANLISNIRISNYSANTGGDTFILYSNGTYANTQVQNCIIDDVTATSGNTSVYGIFGMSGASNNKIGTMTKYGTGVAYGMAYCKKCQQNNVVGASTAKYYLSYADSGTSNAAADTSSGGFNS